MDFSHISIWSQSLLFCVIPISSCWFKDIIPGILWTASLQQFFSFPPTYLSLFLLYSWNQCTHTIIEILLFHLPSLIYLLLDCIYWKTPRELSILIISHYLHPYSFKPTQVGSLPPSLYQNISPCVPLMSILGNPESTVSSRLTTLTHFLHLHFILPIHSLVYPSS